MRLAIRFYGKKVRLEYKPLPLEGYSHVDIGTCFTEASTSVKSLRPSSKHWRSLVLARGRQEPLETLVDWWLMSIRWEAAWPWPGVCPSLITLPVPVTVTGRHGTCSCDWWMSFKKNMSWPLCVIVLVFGPIARNLVLLPVLPGDIIISQEDTSWRWRRKYEADSLFCVNYCSSNNLVDRRCWQRRRKS